VEPRAAAESDQESGLVVVLSYNVITEFDLLMLLRAPAFYNEELAYIDILANSKIRFDSVKRMAQIQNTS
jgi:hypothetical protein